MIMKADYILVKPESWPEQKIGSVLLPDNQEVRKAFSRGTVRGVGPGLFLPNGERPPVEVQSGDHVLYFKAQASPIVVGGENMHIVNERQILAVLEPNDFGKQETR